MKVLVRLQNYYWPRLTGRLRLVPAPDGGWIEAGVEAQQAFRLDAAGVMRDLSIDERSLTDAYHFLVERGLDREPRDGLAILRRARPRAWHIRWRGPPRQAQDHFDAAEILRRFLTEVTGELPSAPSSWPMDGRQAERIRMYDRGPAAPFDRDELRAELNAVELDPHGPHVVGEGPSEAIIVETLIGALLGWTGLQLVTFSDLGGSGAAARVEEQVRTLNKYALRTFVIVDREGLMAEYLKGAFDRGTIDEDDVLLFDDSLEASNATPAELIALAQEIAQNPQEGRERANLQLSPEVLVAYHRDRRERSPKRHRPGLADSLITLARRDEHGNVELDKPSLVDALAGMLVKELETAQEPEEVDRIGEKRPIVRFVLDRLAPLIERARPAGPAV